MEDTRKRPGDDDVVIATEENPAKKQQKLDLEAAEGGKSGNDVVLDLDDEELKVLMQLFDDSSAPEKSGIFPAGMVRFIGNPYAPASVFQTAPSSYVTINGNEESCGSSFSDSASSMMVSVDVGFRAGFYGGGVDVGAEVVESSFSEVGGGGGAFGGAIRTQEAGLESSEVGKRLLEEVDGAKCGVSGGACCGIEAARVGELKLDAEWDDAALETFFGEDLHNDGHFC